MKDKNQRIYRAFADFVNVLKDAGDAPASVVYDGAERTLTFRFSEQPDFSRPGEWDWCDASSLALTENIDELS